MSLFIPHWKFTQYSVTEQKGIHGSEIDTIDLVTDVCVCDPNSFIVHVDISLLSN